ncbi:unnamed protein product [Prorocentrum cordatum]|uniref:Protein kinase domain-containing protein n=1 Tax=Prorocentrum cordatum TaxID=2364126 RepID=A0ABN9PDM8_9DINO|nr:unnamed protein product [Polarella glacialis]
MAPLQGSQCHAPAWVAMGRSSAIGPVDLRHAQTWLDSRLRDLNEDDFEGGLRIFCTSNLVPPEAFQDVWHVISRDSDIREGTPLLSGEDSAQLHTILVFCNQNSCNEVKRLCDIITNIDTGSQDAPPMFWVPHSAAPGSQRQDNSDLVRPELVGDLLHKGLDGIVCGEPAGLRLSMAVRSMIRKSASLSRNLTEMVAETRSRTQYAEYLQHCAHATLWDYVRARLAPEIPPVDHNLEPGEPQELPGYIIGNKLGQGMFGSVYKLTEGPGVGNRVQVVKVVSTEAITEIRDLMYLNRMIRVMQMLSDEETRHPNIIRLHQTYHSPTHIIFRLEYGGPENLYRRLHHRQALQPEKQRPLSIDRVVKIASQCVEAVWHMHAVVQVCHRDIKPENIIVNETPETITIKLADFDLSVIIQDDSKMCQSPCGTVPFAAPEVLRDGPAFDPCPADIWSLGVVLAEVFCGVRVVELAIKDAEPEVRPEGENTTFTECIQTFFQMPAAVANMLEKSCRPELRSLLPTCSAMLTGMLVVDPTQRMEADDVRSVVEQGFAPLALGPVAPAGPPAPGGRRRPAPPRGAAEGAPAAGVTP